MKSKLLSAPYIVWMILFTLIPLGIVFYYALTDSDHRRVYICKPHLHGNVSPDLPALDLADACLPRLSALSSATRSRISSRSASR
ncbi:MAG: hypothetical protein ACLR8U_04565 [Oscillospiraceae bacterium]